MSRASLAAILLAETFTQCTLPRERPNSSLQIVDEVSIDSDFVDRIILCADSSLSIGNGYFNTIILQKRGQSLAAITDENGYDVVQLSLASPGVVEAFEYFLLIKTAKRDFLCFTGPAYASNAPVLTVIKVDGMGAQQIFKDDFEVDKIVKSSLSFR